MGESMADRVRGLFKSGAIVFTGYVAEQVIAIVAKLIVARELGRFDYGAVAIGATLFSVVSVLAVLGLHSGVGRYLPRRESAADRRGVVLSALQIAVPASVVLGIALFAAADVLARRVFADPTVDPAIVATVVRVFAVALPFLALSKVAAGAVQGVKRSLPRVVMRNLVVPSTRFVLVVVAIVAGFRAVGIAWAYALAHVAAGLVGLYYLRRYTSVFERRAYTPIRRELLSYALPLVAATVTMSVLKDIDTFFLAAYATIGEVGTYNVVYPIAAFLFVLVPSFAHLTMPNLAELHEAGEFDRMDRLYRVATKWTVLGTFPLFAGVLLFPRLAIRIPFGAEYVAGAPALRILAVGYFLRTIGGPNSRALMAIGSTRRVMYANAAVAALNVGLNFLLIPRYRLLGAATATAVSFAALNVLYGAFLYDETSMTPFSGSLYRPLAAATAILGPLYLVATGLFGPSLAVAVGLLIVGGLLYPVVIVAAGGVQREELIVVESVEHRFGIDLEPAKRVARRLR